VDAKAYPIETVFGGEKQFTVPRFQRGYRWKKEEHWQPLWEELEDMAERLLGGAEVDSYYLGAIVVQPMPARGFRPGEYQVVDGQQRLTTLQLLLAALRDVCNELAFPRQISVTALIQNREVVGNDHPTDVFKVWPTDIDRETFRLLLNADPKQEIDQRWPAPRRARAGAERPGLVRAYTYFRDEIEEFARGAVGGETVPQHESWRRLERLLEVLRQKIHLVSIELGKQDDPMMIFEALNGRAERLLPSDLIKNAVLRSAGANAERLHDVYWNRFGGDQQEAGTSFWQGEHKRGRLNRSRLDLFLTDYLQFNTQTEVKAPDLFKHFSNWWKSEMKRISPEQLMKTMVEYADVYKRLLTADRVDDDPASVFCANVRLMDFTLAYPLLLALLKELPDDGGMAANDLPGILQDVESYLVRRVVCGLTGKKYNYVFPEILKSIRQTRERGEIVTRQSVRQRLLGFNGETVEWPSNRFFARCWVEDAFYGRLTQKFQIVIFTRLAEARRRQYREPAQILYEQMTVEHLLPQSWQEHWAPPTDTGSYRGESETPDQRRARLIQTIGNLTLLGQPLNSAVSNGPWLQKREEIRKHGVFSLNADFTGIDRWDEQSIISRSKALLAEAMQVWPYPVDRDDQLGEDSEIPAMVAVASPPTSFQTHSMAPSAADHPKLDEAIIRTEKKIPVPGIPIARDGNPFRTGSFYWAIVEALNALGSEKMFPFHDIIPVIRKKLGDAKWNDFVNKPGEPAEARATTNIYTLTRRDYGQPLRERGYEVRYDGPQQQGGIFRIPAVRTEA
jgi:hypothetical protein